VGEIVVDSQYLDPFTLNRRSDLSFSDDENSYDQDEGVRLACKKASAAAASKAATDAAFVLSALVDQDLKVAKAEKELKKNKIRFSFRRPNNKAVNPDPSKKEEKINVMSLRILLVDDTLSVQKLMGRWLKNQGCEVTYALNGKIGLHLLKTQQFDICFMDFLMVCYILYY
jgi:PleD family two-component response regulator